MANEEPVPSTSSVLSAAEKNVKIDPPTSKKRKGLDIDALWRKKFKDVENQKSPEKPATSPDSSKPGSSEEGTSSATISPVEKSLEPSSEDIKPSDLVSSPEKPSEPETADVVVKKLTSSGSSVTTPSKTSSTPITTTPIGTKTIKKEILKSAPPAPPPQQEKSPSPIGRTTRSARKKTEAVRKGMNDLEDVKPNIKFLKKSLQNANGNGSEIEVIRRQGDGSNGGPDDYDYEPMEYGNAVTPNGTYTIYGPDATYTQYYPYSTGTLQASPEEAGGQYLNQGQQSPISNEDQETTILQNNQRASPATVNWLFDNYEIAEGSSLPRCQLYDHYKKHCEEHRMDPVNAASFGKLIRSVFQNLKTRRLGTRGNSKYHYYGIRMKATSTLHDVPQLQLPPVHNQVYTPPMQQLPNRDSYADTVNTVASQKYSEIAMKRSRKRSASSSARESPESPGMELANQHVFLDHSSSGVIPAQVNYALNGPYVFTETDKASLGKAELPKTIFKDKDAFIAHHSFRKFGVTSTLFNEFLEDYDLMCREVLGNVQQVKFCEVQEIWNNFWGGQTRFEHVDLIALLAIDRVVDWIIEVDINLYQTIVDCLIPHVLLSELSPGMTQSCRTFSKNTDINLRKAMINGKMPEAFIKRKIQAITYMQQGLKRYTSLNHLAHAARGVLMKPDQCHQMYLDYSKVDIDAVHQQAGWICGCEGGVVNTINTAFKNNLFKTSPMETWALWLESIVDQVLAKYQDKPAKEVENVGKQFLLNWSFYTSMIIRDLTLRSAVSFGSFTLIRLLADDYMYYLIESKIAKAANQQLITVIRQEKEWPLPKNNQEYIVPSKDASTVENGK